MLRRLLSNRKVGVVAMFSTPWFCFDQIISWAESARAHHFTFISYTSHVYSKRNTVRSRQQQLPSQASVSRWITSASGPGTFFSPRRNRRFAEAFHHKCRFVVLAKYGIQKFSHPSILPDFYIKMMFTFCFYPPIEFISCTSTKS